MNASHTLFPNLPAAPVVSPPARGGVHDASRIPEEEKGKLRALYKNLGSIDAVVKATHHGWKTVAMICDPERLHQGVTIEQVTDVKRMLATGASLAHAAKESGLRLRQVASIQAADPELSRIAQATRGARAIASESVAMEALLDTIERRQDAGKLTVAEAANTLMVLNNMARDTVGGTAVKIQVDVNHTHQTSSALMASLVHGGNGIEIPKPPAPIIDVETVASNP